MDVLMVIAVFVFAAVGLVCSSLWLFNYWHDAILLFKEFKSKNTKGNRSINNFEIAWQGAQAFGKVEPGDCPYREGTSDYSDWMKGVMFAVRLYGKGYSDCEKSVSTYDEDD